ncbi:MAG: hypothetical protein CME62_08950 [Halobacteriovoraceae bacterium]|nr:hypothetical protein [Halobacteriovoraceae bacterium]|tara:strand:- start:6255 stop:7565 length:1311 start_codon:yes stop_codon:yes gene_type:complete
MSNIIVWGFCGKTNNIIDELRANKHLDIFTISDHPSADLNIISCFKRRFSFPKKSSFEVSKMESFFLEFKELYSRHWYPKKMSNQKYREIFTNYIHYFWNLLESRKISTVIFSNIPHEGPDFILYHLAKYKNVKTLIFYQSLFENRVFLSETLDFLDNQLVKTTELHKKSPQQEIEYKVDKTIESVGCWFYMRRMKISNNLAPIQLYRNSRRHFKKNAFLLLKILFAEIAHFFHYHMTNKDSLSLKDSDYVYFPLHLQPELTTAVLGGVYVDQILALKKLRELLPENIKIVVKENPFQSSFKRPLGYYFELKKIKNLLLVPMSYNSIDLIYNSKGVATITGTCGWEAINMNKPALVFGKAWYCKLKGVYNYNSEIERREFLKFETENYNVRENTIEFVKNYTIPGIVDPAYIKIYKDFKPIENIRCLVEVITNNIK